MHRVDVGTERTEHVAGSFAHRTPSLLGGPNPFQAGAWCPRWLIVMPTLHPTPRQCPRNCRVAGASPVVPLHKLPFAWRKVNRVANRGSRV